MLLAKKKRLKAQLRQLNYVSNGDASNGSRDR
jgi:hypothetical protein